MLKDIDKLRDERKSRVNPALPKIIFNKIRKSGVKTLVISGAHSNIGKTHFATELLKGLSNWSALKITVSHGKKDSKCPRASKCNVCSKLSNKYDIITDQNIINEPDKDTARLKQAGAKKVVWLQASPKGLEKGLKKALRILDKSEGVVIEGTSVLKVMKPDLAIYLKDKSADLKPGARQAKIKADIIIDVSR